MLTLNHIAAQPEWPVAGDGPINRVHRLVERLMQREAAHSVDGQRIVVPDEDCRAAAFLLSALLGPRAELPDAGAPWIKWTGGECPVASNVKVKVWLANDLSETAALHYPARSASFWHHAWRRGPKVPNRIIAYFVVEE